MGGLDARVLPGQLVTVHGRQDLPGIIVQTPNRLLPSDAQDRQVQLQYLLVDTGLFPRQVARLVRAGDLVSFAQPPVELKSEILTGHSLDNRASIAAVTQCLQELAGRLPRCQVWLYERLSTRGAEWRMTRIKPQR